MLTKRLPPQFGPNAIEAAGRHESFLEAAAEQDVTPAQPTILRQLPNAEFRITAGNVLLSPQC